MPSRSSTRVGLAVAIALSTVYVGRAERPGAELGPLGAASETFERLKDLVGEWTGAWEPGSMPTRVVYSLTGNGSVLVEDYRIDDTTMSTLYHLDGEELMLTHYCSKANQPRMRATSLGEDGPLEFVAFDVTNNLTGGYSKALTLELIDRDRISISYTGSRTGGTSGVRLRRVR